MSRFPVYLKLVILLAIATGCALRFYNLTQKFYWFDEAFTSLRISGYTEAELIDWLSRSAPVSVADLLREFQLPSKTLWDTTVSLATEEPQHPPLYFAIARLWMQGWMAFQEPGQLVGTAPIAALRSLSAVASLLALPLIYALARLLFGAAAGWVAIALLAVSPLQVLYAQEAREYSLWTVMILLSSVLLLQAMRRGDREGNRLSWLLYGVSLALGLYTFPSTLLVMLAQGLYVWLTGVWAGSERTKQPFRSYLLATLLGLVAFVPWIMALVLGVAQINQTFVKPERVSPEALLFGWAINLCRIFVDYADYERQIKYLGWTRPWEYLIYGLFVFLFLVLVGFALWDLGNRLLREIDCSGLFVLLLIGVTSLPIALVNLSSMGRQSLVLRYLMPAVLGIELAIAALIATRLAVSSRNSQKLGSKIWQAVLILILSGGIVSCAASAQAHFWWSKSRSDLNYLAAVAINQSVHQAIDPNNSRLPPLLISDASTGRILGFIHRLDPEVQLLLRPLCYSCVEPDQPEFTQPDLTALNSEYRQVFLYNPSPALVDRFKSSQFSLKPVFSDPIHAEQQVLSLESRSAR